MIFINNEIMFFLMNYEWHFLKYKNQQISLYFTKLIVNLKIFEVGVPIHHNLRVYRRTSLNILKKDKVILYTYFCNSIYYVSHISAVSKWHLSLKNNPLTTPLQVGHEANKIHMKYPRNIYPLRQIFLFRWYFVHKCKISGGYLIITVNS